MKKVVYISLIIPALICIMLSGGCADQKFAEESGRGTTGTPVMVSVSLKIPEFEVPSGAVSRSSGSDTEQKFQIRLGENPNPDQPASKAQTRSDGTTSLYNLWVLQFDADNNFRKAVKISNTPEPVKDMVTIDAELYTGQNQTIYLIALGKQYGEVNLSGVKNIKELESYGLSSIRYVDGLPVPVIQNREDVPYCGSYSGLEIVQIEEGDHGRIKYNPQASFTGAIPMRAMVSKVTFNFSYQVENLTPYLLMLNNVPTTFSIVASNDKPAQMVNLPAIVLNPADLSNNKRCEYSWYLAPNRQGTVPAITTESDRYFYYTTGTTTDGKAPQMGTYLHLWASDDTKADNYALYYIFLGSNTTDDFNIHPNSHYKLRSDVNIAPNQNDKRVIFKTLQQTIDFSCSGTITGMLPGGRNSKIYDLDSHPDMRPIEITALRGKVDVMITSTSTGDPVQSEKSWLKLSTSPNYTDAIRRVQQGDEQGLSTSLTLDASIPGLFRLYLYSDEYERFTYLDPSTKLTRRLYLRFTFRTSATDAGKTYTCYMDQRPGFYVGQFGGTRDSNTGEYDQGLVYEAIKEEDNYQYLSYYQKGLYMLRGHYPNANFEQLQLYDAWNRDNGKEATRQMAENAVPDLKVYSRYDRPNATTPKWVNGIPDLYQYKYYNLDGFAIRSCYDKNRDTNGNGVIDPDEMVWYMPAHHQLSVIHFNYFGKSDPIYASIFSTNNIYSTSMLTNEYGYMNTVYSHSGNKNGYYLVNQQMTHHCVRDVKLPASSSYPTGPKVYAEGGYAVIDVTGMTYASIVSKVNNLTYVRDDGRTVRNATLTSANKTDETLRYATVSSRFAISPENLKNDAGNNLTLNWAEAAGFNTTGNNYPLNSVLEKAETGCGAYRGKDGTDTPGTWRLPTEAEMSLVDLMEQGLISTALVTGFKALDTAIPLLLPPTVDRGAIETNYWTATEERSSANISYASQLHETFQYKTANKTMSMGRYIIKNQKKTAKCLVRCIRDLP